MAELIQQHPRQLLAGSAGREYDIRIYARQADATWEGWLEFHPASGGLVLKTGRETTQTTRQALHDWAAGLGMTYFEGAFQRAFDNSSQSAARIAQAGAGEGDTRERIGPDQS